MQRARDATTSTAAQSRQPLPWAERITPSPWPAAFIALSVVAAGSGMVASVARAPLGNRVDLVVTADSREDTTQAAAAALEAELIRQLRALSLDVGGSPDGAVAAVAVHATLHSQPDPRLPNATAVRTVFHVEVRDDDAGGPGVAEALGFGATPLLAAINGGQRAAWVAVGKIAALVAASPGRDRGLRRITDGRGPLRVFAQARAELLENRDARFKALVDARTPAAEPSLGLSDRRENARLLGVVGEHLALVVVEDREPLLLPVARRDPQLLLGAEHLELRSPTFRQRLLSAYHVASGGAVTPDGRAAAVALIQGDGEAALCRLALPAGTVRCAPLGPRPVVEALAISADGSAVLGRAAACASGCREDLVWWHPDGGEPPRVQRLPRGQLRGAVLETPDRAHGQAVVVEGRRAAVEAWSWSTDQLQPTRLGPVPPHAVLHTTLAGAPPPALAELAGLPPRVTSLAWLDGQQALAVVEGDGAVPRSRLALYRAPEGTLDYLTRSLGRESRPVVSPGGTAVFFEVEHPDPDVAASWTQVRRLELPGNGAAGSAPARCF